MVTNLEMLKHTQDLTCKKYDYILQLKTSSTKVELLKMGVALKKYYTFPVALAI